MSRMRLILMAASLALTGLLAAWGIVWSQGPESQGDVVAKVGNSVITRAEFEWELIRRAGPRLLIKIIDEAVIRRAAKRAGIEVTEEQVDLRMNQAVARAGSKTDLERILDRRGQTVEDYRVELELAALWDMLARREVEATEEELSEYYREHLDESKYGEQVRMRLYLGSSPENAQTFKEMLEAGGDFAGLAQAVSEDPGTRENGGDTGWIERDDYAPEITDVAFSLEKGQTSDIFEAPDGWAIVRVEDRRLPGVLPFDEVRDKVQQRVIREKLRQIRKEWLVEQRKRARIVIHDEQLRRGVMALLEAAPGPGEESFYGGPPGTP